MPEADNYPEILSEHATVVAATLVDEGIDIAQAQALARAVTERVRIALGGCYIPRGTFLDIDRMRQDIGQRWNGSNTRELCREYGITERSLRRYAEQARKTT